MRFAPPRLNEVTEFGQMVSSILGTALAGAIIVCFGSLFAAVPDTLFYTAAGYLLAGLLWFIIGFSHGRDKDLALVRLCLVFTVMIGIITYFH